MHNQIRNERLSDGSWIVGAVSNAYKDTAGSGWSFAGLWGLVLQGERLRKKQQDYITYGGVEALRDLRDYDWREFIKNTTGSDVTVKLDGDVYTLENGVSYCVGRSEYLLMKQQVKGLVKVSPAEYRISGVAMTFVS